MNLHALTLPKKICVIGAGNIGTLLAAEFAHQSIETVLYSSKPDKISDSITVLGRDGELLFEAQGVKATDSLSSAVEGAELIVITHPSFLLPSLAAQLLPLVQPGQILLCIPGGSAEYAFLPHIEKGCILCGLQRVHSIARIGEYGKSVFMLGRKSEVQLAAISGEKTAECAAADIAAMISALLQMPCVSLQNYLVLTLTPSNPILHTSRLFSMLRDYHPGAVFDHNPLFYEEWTDDSSRVMLSGDDELQGLCAGLEKLGLSMGEVRSLREHYESDTPEKMTKKISGIPAFRGLASPMKQTEQGWIPDFSSRYFTADFAYGLKAILDIGDLLQEKMETLQQIWQWYLAVTKECGEPSRSCFHLPQGVKTPAQLAALYKQSGALPR